ncbi:hypothetical protein B9Z55_020510 [Caenorhabditis nigoni]|uniref:Uncharacterized protein n=1 Tax=Caenorhabditis nigoni TaxID=1611254 RepID=A0A2G5TN34_9PELO|nr:hypothetical protein B9Z55_020510 [Caenorhabditis nigoni]
MRVPLLVEREDCNDPFTTIRMLLLLEELASAFGFVHVASAFGSLISESNVGDPLREVSDVQMSHHTGDSSPFYSIFHHYAPDLIW